MDPEKALELVKHGVTLLLLDVPQCTLVGIDTPYFGIYILVLCFVAGINMEEMNRVVPIPIIEELKSNESSTMEWVVQINKELESDESSTKMEKEEWEKHSIYKIPARVTDLNKGAYKPQAVSFGPYHYGEEHLMAMEEHKHRALLHFLKRCEKQFAFLFKSMVQVEQDLRDSYKPLDWKQGNDGFLRLMILDGCFMLEILRTADGV